MVFIHFICFEAKVYAVGPKARPMLGGRAKGHGPVGPRSRGAVGPWGRGAVGPWGQGAVGPSCK